MQHVVSGLERWLGTEPSEWALPANARIGFLGHAASVDRHAHHALDRILEVKRYRLERLFAPEHGLWGHEQDMESVNHAMDPVTGCPVVSLYGNLESSLRPTADSLCDLDALIVDLQDIGSRFYTYIYTLAYVMEAARDADLRVVVLDRPNPIGGLDVEGPVLDPRFTSFVGRYPLPIRHGMTVGELASLFNDRFGIGCRLTVVEMAGYRREFYADQCGLPWIPPSPNMPSLQTAWVYPGGCLIEGTELSEGRGTTTPFELVGDPQLDGRELCRRMIAARLGGVMFRHASFRPMFQKHAGRACEGVQVIPFDRGVFLPLRTYLQLILECSRLMGDAFRWREKAYEFVHDRLAIDLLLGRRDLREALESGSPIEELESMWADELSEFEKTRAQYLIYG